MFADIVHEEGETDLGILGRDDMVSTICPTLATTASLPVSSGLKCSLRER